VMMLFAPCEIKMHSLNALLALRSTDHLSQWLVNLDATCLLFCQSSLMKEELVLLAFMRLLMKLVDNSCPKGHQKNAKHENCIINRAERSLGWPAKKQKFIAGGCREL
jgi:hypothetical protein